MMQRKLKLKPTLLLLPKVRALVLLKAMVPLLGWMLELVTVTVALLKILKMLP